VPFTDRHARRVRAGLPRGRSERLPRALGEGNAMDPVIARAIGATVGFVEKREPAFALR
jgi:hypothetical protein